MQQKASTISNIWLAMVLLATVTAAYTGRMPELIKAVFDAAKDGVILAIGLIGPMAFWLGLMRVVEAGGLMRIIARIVRPVMIRLFPEVPAEHPAMGAMIMNMAANMLGLGNAATPMGIKAMQELHRLAPEKGTATNAMCLFLAINTSSVTILPLGMIAMRAAANAKDPAAILIPSILATTCSTIMAIFAAKAMQGNARRGQGLPRAAEMAPEAPVISPDRTIVDLCPPSLAGRSLVWILVALFAGAPLYRLISSESFEMSLNSVKTLSDWLVPMLVAFFLIFGYLRGVRLYETLTEGAKEGFNTAVRIIPFMVAIFVAIGMFRASGALDMMVGLFSPVTNLFGVPAEALTMAFLRPLSGSGSFGFASELVTREPDGFLSFLVCVMQGSTETTFYVLAVYFGSIGIKKTRHALPAALLADGAGMIAAIVFSRLWYG